MSPASLWGLTPAPTRYLIEQGIQLVGIDYLSVEAFHAPGHPVHRHLLGAGVVILEGLNLAGVEPGVFELLLRRAT